MQPGPHRPSSTYLHCDFRLKMWVWSAHCTLDHLLLGSGTPEPGGAEARSCSLRFCHVVCSCVRTVPTSSLLGGIYPLLLYCEVVCARSCYFFLKCLAKFTDETIPAGSSFSECGKVSLWPSILKSCKHTELKNPKGTLVYFLSACCD